MNPDFGSPAAAPAGAPHMHHHEEHEGFIEHTSTLSFFLAFLAIYSISSEKGTAALIRYFATRQQFLLPVLEATFAQLMLLGLFSCILFAMNKFGAMAALAPFLKEHAPEVVEIAEIVHFLLFIGLMIYVGTITIVILISVRLVRLWGRNEASGLADVAARYEDLLRESARRGWAAYVNPVFLYHLLDVRYVHHYHLLRADFIAQQHLPDDYNFASYLKRCIGHCFSELVEIHWSNWILLLVIVGINWARYLLVRLASHTDTISTKMHPEFWGAMGGVFMFGAVVLYAKCQWVLMQLASASRRHLARLDLLPSGALPPLQSLPGSTSVPPSLASDAHDIAAEAAAAAAAEDGSAGADASAAAVDSHDVPAVGGGVADDHNDHDPQSTQLLSLNDDAFAQRRRQKHKKLFWFNRPNLLFRLIQLLLLFQSWFVALLVVFLPAEEVDWTPAQIAACFLPPLLTVVTFAPIVLPIFTLIRYVGPYARADLIRSRGRAHGNSHDDPDHDERDDDDDAHHGHDAHGDHNAIVNLLHHEEHH